MAVKKGKAENGAEVIDGEFETIREEIPQVENTPESEGATAGGAESPETEAPRKRGRPRGATSNKSAKTKTAQKADAAKLARQIMGGHIFMAGITGLPELVVDEKEALALAELTIESAERFGYVINSTIGFYIQAFGTLAMIYGPRLYMIQKRFAAETGKTNESNQAPVSYGPYNHQ